jgi:cytochrome c oxidase subunit 2
MMNVIIGIGVVLLLGILYLIFRLTSLVSLAKGRKEEAESSSNRLNAFLFMVFNIGSLVAFFWYSFANFKNYTLPVASEHGEWTDTLFWITMTVIVVAFSIISLVLFWFTWKYQYREGQKAKFFPDNHYLELTWTIVPAIVLTVLIITGLNAWNDITSPASADAEVIEVVGQQFAWTVRYPGVKDKQLGKVDYRKIDPVNEFGLDLSDQNTHDDFKALELHLPVNKEVLLKIRAKDVLHSVFLPHFRVKMDAVPGMPTQFKFKATKTTKEMQEQLKNPEFNYEMACTEICGRGHFSMRLLVIVEDEESYEKWKASQDPWLKQNPGQMANVPDNLKEAAMIKAGISNTVIPVVPASNEGQMVVGSH